MRFRLACPRPDSMIKYNSGVFNNLQQNCYCLLTYYTIPYHYTGLLTSFDTFRPRQNGRHFPEDILKWIFMNENVWIAIKISLKFVPRGPINKIPPLVQIMPWHRPGDKPSSEPMMVSLLTHICITRPQWVKYIQWNASSLLSFYKIYVTQCL